MCLFTRYETPKGRFSFIHDDQRRLRAIDIVRETNTGDRISEYAWVYIFSIYSHFLSIYTRIRGISQHDIISNPFRIFSINFLAYFTVN